MALSSGNVGKYYFLTGKDVLQEKYLLEKAATMKRFEYWPLGSELKKQTDIAKKHNQGLDKIYEFDKKERDETISKDYTKPTLKKYTKSDLIYHNNNGNIEIIILYNYNNIENLMCFILTKYFRAIEI